VLAVILVSCTTLFLVHSTTLSITQITLTYSAPIASQSHVTPDDQSVSPSWCRGPSGSHDRILITGWHLVFCRYRAPPLTRGRVLVIVRPLLVNIYRFTCNAHVCDIYIYIYIYIYMSVQAENSRSCSFLSSLGYNGSLVIWTVVRLTAAKFKPLVLSMPGFALSNVSNICIFVTEMKRSGRRRPCPTWGASPTLAWRTAKENSVELGGPGLQTSIWSRDSVMLWPAQ
jgi:hypothetical protein